MSEGNYSFYSFYNRFFEKYHGFETGRMFSRRLFLINLSIFSLNIRFLTISLSILRQTFGRSDTRTFPSKPPSFSATSNGHQSTDKL